MHAKETPNGEAKDTLKKSIAHIILSLFLLFHIGGASVHAQQVDSLQLDTLSADTLSTTPLRPKKESSIKAPIHYQASDSMVMMGNGTAFLHGSGDLKYETMQLTGDFIRMNIDSSQIYASGVWDSLNYEWKGKPVFKDNKDEYETSEITYNIKTQTIGKINKYAFTTDDYRIFENLNPKRKCDDKDVCFLQALDVLHTKDGGVVVAYNSTYETLLKSQYGISKYKNMGGVMLWRLKPDGTILWNNGFKRNMATGMFENSWYTPHYITDNDEVVFVIETHKKDVPDNTSMANVVVKYYRYEQNPVTGPFPSNITLVRFDKNGNITKEAMPGEKKMLIVGNPNVMDDGKAVLLYVSNKKAPGGLIRMDLK